MKKCPKCGKRMKKIADEYSHLVRDEMLTVKTSVYRCLWCGEMKYEM